MLSQGVCSAQSRVRDALIDKLRVPGRLMSFAPSLADFQSISISPVARLDETKSIQQWSQLRAFLFQQGLRGGLLLGIPDMISRIRLQQISGSIMAWPHYTVPSATGNRHWSDSQLQCPQGYTLAVCLTFLAHNFESHFGEQQHMPRATQELHLHCLHLMEYRKPLTSSSHGV